MINKLNAHIVNSNNTELKDYVGRVLSLEVRNTPHAWDNHNIPNFTYYALVWDFNSTPKSICLGYGDEYIVPPKMAMVDATKPVLEAYNAMLADREKQHIESLREHEAAKIAVGKTVKVFKGRKVAIGTTGRVFWHGDSGYGWSVGIELADGKRVFTSESNVKVA